jgi:hypothetical protein
VNDNNAEEYVLTAGNYYGGEDIPVGRYDMVWVSGEGRYYVHRADGSGMSGGYMKAEIIEPLSFNEKDSMRCMLTIMKADRFEIMNSLSVRLIKK